MNHISLSDKQLTTLIAIIQDAAERTEYPDPDNPPTEIVMAYELAATLRRFRRKTELRFQNPLHADLSNEHHLVYLGPDYTLLAIDIIFINLSWDDMMLSDLESLNRHKILSQTLQKLTNINQATSWGTDMRN